MMTFEEASPLCDEIVAFLISCGDTYTQANGELETNILWALASGQYVMQRDENGQILYFASYWRVHAEDIEAVEDRTRPDDVFHGSTMVVSECGNMGGRRGMAEIVRGLRIKGRGMQGVYWHRVKRGHSDRWHGFTRQKGVEHGEQ